MLSRKLLSRRIVAARPLSRALRPAASTTLRTQIRRAATDAPIEEDDDYSYAFVEPDAETDPGMNGGYINPPPIKRQHRDPYADWWDKQERRNYGEPVHEDNDILGMFSPEDYTHFSSGWGAVLLGTFIATTLGLCGIVKLYYPDKPSAPRTFPDGLEKELGGPTALRARKEGEDLSW
ncbi:hypothetical protein K490DRAFT_54126 [Saccharata proteae CBS 121410]|uniref:NADH:ubiquinone oxidoreductase 20.1kD subunit n=1 Tax=Saccharata proteae CBS 121410 TaxID=1314787 RepID=A0A9P4I0I3_9PEZI|nr:hypothetical protein K490DRAFT_54126 [Saccharata proteae CBS 121410]